MAKAFIKDSCILCGQCMIYCPFKALTPKNRKMSVNYEHCTGCGKCVNRCLMGAIVLAEDGM